MTNKRKTVAIIPYLVNTDNKLSCLVQIRDANTTHHPNVFWSFGGGLEGEENHQQAAEREFNEEIVLVKIRNKRIVNVSPLEGRILPVLEKDGSFLEIESDVSIKRMYGLSGDEISYAKNGDLLKEHVVRYMSDQLQNEVLSDDDDYLVALEGKGSKWLEEDEIIKGHELLPESFRDDLLVFMDLVGNT